MKPSWPITLFAAWCVLVLLAFTVANADGYAAFATASHPTPVRPEPGQRHK